jgi:alpha-mannosidase
MEPTKITLVPHTHWDREWYGPFDEFLPRLVAMMDTLIEQAERGFPHFHLDGQTAMIDDYLAVRPEREGDVKRLARERKLSVGPWVTQMDEFLTSGESHIRNLEMGLARACELGPALEVGYLPDQFGHIGQMPQILRQAGIERRGPAWRSASHRQDGVLVGIAGRQPGDDRVPRVPLLPGGDLERFQDADRSRYRGTTGSHRTCRDRKHPL